MRRSAFGLALTLSVLLPAQLFAGGLSSAFDPTVFTVAICDAAHPVDFEHPDNGCWGTVIETEFSEAPDKHLLHYLVYAFSDPDHSFFLTTGAFKSKAGEGCCGVVVEKGLHRYALGGEFLPPGVPSGWDLYLETRLTGQPEQEYGVFARPPGASDFATTATTVTPEPATWLLLGSGMAGIGIWRRRRRPVL